MTSERTPASPKSPFFNRMVAVLLFALCLWLLIMDLRFPVDMLFQTSFSSMVTALVISVWFMVAIGMAVFPKRIVIGASILISLRGAIGWPLNIWLENTPACQIVSVLLFVLALVYLVAAFRGSLRIPARPMLHWKHSLVMALVWLPLGLVTIPITLSGLTEGVENFAGEYIDIGLHGLDLKERVFEKDGKTIHLVGMVHVGDAAFYKEMDDRLKDAAGRHLVLTEGVDDKDGMLPENFRTGATYSKMAKRFGLTPQRHEGAEVTAKTKDAWEDAWKARGFTFKNADIDISELDEEHLETLILILELMDVENLSELIFMNPNDLPAVEIHDAFVEGLLMQRNDHLMAVLEENIADFDVVHIPWGAAHLPDIEERLLGQGYVEKEEIERRAIDLKKRLLK